MRSSSLSPSRLETRISSDPKALDYEACQVIFPTVVLIGELLEC